MYSGKHAKKVSEQVTEPTVLAGDNSPSPSSSTQANVFLLAETASQPHPVS